MEFNKSGGLRTKGVNKSSEENFPLISVITVVYNGVKHLEQTILSILNQTYTNIEYLIIDGGSTDGTVEILKKYEDKIDFWVSEPDKGIYHAMNKGIELAKGNLISILNSDDWYENYSISEVVTNYKAFPEADIYHGLHRLWENSEMMGIIGHTNFFLKYGMISHPTCFVKNEVYRNHGVYSLRYRIVSDYELMLRFNSLKLKFHLIEKVLANFRNNGLSNILKKNTMLETAEIKKKYSLISPTEMFIARLGYLARLVFND